MKYTVVIDLTLKESKKEYEMAGFQNESDSIILQKKSCLQYTLNFVATKSLLNFKEKN